MNYLTNLFFKSKIIRLFTVICILYFGVYKYDKSDDSLSSKINRESLSKNFDIAKGQTKKIIDVISEVKKAENLNDGSSQELSTKSSREVVDVIKSIIDQIDMVDHNISTSNSGKKSSNAKKAICNSTVTYDLLIFDSKNENIHTSKNKSLRISENRNLLFERKMLGVYSGKTIKFKIDSDQKFIPSLVRKFYIQSGGEVEVWLKIKRVIHNTMFQSDANRTICI